MAEGGKGLGVKEVRVGVGATVMPIEDGQRSVSRETLDVATDGDPLI